MSQELPAPVQGRDSIVIAAAFDVVWPLIADSYALMKWGPPVRAVDVIDEPEGVGTRRRVQAVLGKQVCEFVERRLVHDEPWRMAFLIEEETFGLFRFLGQVGSLMELETVQPGQTRLVWSFFHEPRGMVGKVMNRLVILRQQRINRRRALASLKAYVEGGIERPAP